MHIKENIKNRIVAMLMCILLLSNFGISIASATMTGNSGMGYVNFYNGNSLNSETKINENRMIANYSDVSQMYIEPKETAIYTITIENAAANVKYTLKNSETGKYAALASTYHQPEVPLTPNTNANSTTIDVVLKAGQKYHIEVKDSNTEAVVTITKRNIMPSAIMATNIPSNIASAKEDYKPKKMKVESFEDTNIKTVNFTKEGIEKYALAGMESDDKIAKGGWLEGVLVDLIMLVLSTFIHIVEWAIGTEEGLTIDNIIFNRFEQTVIDLTPLGGIELSEGSTGKGFFYNENIISVIKVLYDGMKVLAIIIYIVMLLYIGVKILLSIGTKEQKKYTKYIEYWLTGIVLLIVIPYFLPLLPTITNSLVALMEEQARSLNGKYSVEEVLEALGNDTTYLGEDAEIVTLHALIDGEIDRLMGLQTNPPKTKEEARAAIDELIKSKYEEYSGDAVLNEKINAVITFIDENYGVDWTPEMVEKYDELVLDVKEEVFSKETKSSEIITNMNLPDIIKNSETWNRRKYGLYIAMNRWAADISNMENRKRMYDRFDEIIESIKKETNNGISIFEIVRARTTVMHTAIRVSNLENTFAINLQNIFTSYRDAVVQGRIEQLTDYKLGLSEDIMTTLKSTAQEENRFIYAVAWAILVIQMLAILFMYYKRIFAILVLIIIFPLVMAFYVIDKMKDGKAQSLEVWFKELFANLIVQVLHAGIYIILINIGIDACNSNPGKYWFILILTVCFLFPGERILRGIIDLRASTLDEMKNKGLMAAGVIGIASMIRGRRAVKNFKANGGVKGVKDRASDAWNKKKDEWKKELEAPEKKKEKSRKEKEALQRRKNDSRNYRQQLIAAGEAGALTRFHEKVDTFKDNTKQKINGFALVKGTKAAVSAVKSSGVGKAVGKAAKFTNKYGRFALKKAGKLAKKTAGVTMATVEGMESFGKEGLISGASTFAHTSNRLGVYDSKARRAKAATNSNDNSNAKTAKNNVAEAKYGTVYQNANMVKAGDNANVSVNNTARNSNNSNANRPVEYYSSRTAGKAIKSNLNVNKNVTKNETNNRNS